CPKAPARWRRCLQPALLSAVPGSARISAKRKDRRTPAGPWKLPARLVAVPFRLELAAGAAIQWTAARRRGYRHALARPHHMDYEPESYRALRRLRHGSAHPAKTAGASGDFLEAQRHRIRRSKN